MLSAMRLVGVFALCLVSSAQAAEYAPIINEGGRCLDLAAPDIGKDGGHVQTFDCNGSPSQQWQQDAQGRVQHISGKCLDVNGPDLHKAGGKVQTWSCNGAPNQQWTMDDHGRLKNGGGLCLDVAGPDLFKSGGGLVHIWHCNDAPNQHWWYAERTQTAAPVAEPVAKPVAKTTPPPAKQLNPQPAKPAPTAQAAKPAAAATPNLKTVTIKEPKAPFTGIVAEHNKWREAVGVPPLVWAEEVAKYAREWASTLNKQHGKKEFCGLKHRPSPRYGENLFAGYRMTAQAAVNMWAAERHDYDDETNRCTAGKICSHYTQMVWRATQRLGCAEAQCANGTKIWVCNYDPYGNIMGQKPY